MKTSSSSLFLYAIAGIVTVGLIGYVVTQDRAPSPYDGFAQCLTDKGVKMYGAWWCPHCKKQRELFGKSFDKVEYIECSPNGSKTTSVQCTQAGVKGFPTWMFADGSTLGGEQSFEALGERAGCPVPAPAP